MAGASHKVLAVHCNVDRDGKAEVFRVGEGGVKEIGSHSPLGPGDCWYYEVVFNDGSFIRIFNMSRVEMSKPIRVEVPGKKEIII